MNSPLISIIVPIYKVEPYLSKCLDSIICQTYRYLEIILIDDGSPDSCGEISDEYASNDSRIIVIHQENAGLSAARNAGLDVARGEYILFVDSDDWIEKETCEYLISIVQQQNVDIICFGYNMVYESGKTEVLSMDRSYKARKEEIIRILITGNPLAIRDYAWNKFFSKKLFESIRFPVGYVYEDMGTIYKLIHQAKKIYVTDKILYNYYIRGSGSITANHFSFTNIRDRVTLLKERLIFIRDYYQNLIDLQLLMIIRELLVGHDSVKDIEDRRILSQELEQLIGEYKTRMPCLAKKSKIVWVLYYCPVLLKPVMRLRRYLINE